METVIRNVVKATTELALPRAGVITCDRFRVPASPVPGAPPTGVLIRSTGTAVPDEEPIARSGRKAALGQRHLSRRYRSRHFGLPLLSVPEGSSRRLTQPCTKSKFRIPEVYQSFPRTRARPALTGTAVRPEGCSVRAAERRADPANRDSCPGWRRVTRASWKSTAVRP